MKLTPWSLALAAMRVAVASSVGPPNIIVPRQSGETFTPLFPRLRCFMNCPGTLRAAAASFYAGLTLGRSKNIKRTNKRKPAGNRDGKEAYRERAGPVRARSRQGRASGRGIPQPDGGAEGGRRLPALPALPKRNANRV